MTDKNPADEVPDEMYNVHIDLLSELFFDGMLSGMSTGLINVTTMKMSQARATALRHVQACFKDPALRETVRDAVRAKIAGEQFTGTILKVREEKW